MKHGRSGFKFKSFMVRLIMAKLFDDGKDFSDYPEELQHFFTYIANSDLAELITFNDYWEKSQVPASLERVKIVDPVNWNNNAAKLYTVTQADTILDAALDVGDAIHAALSATTKAKQCITGRNDSVHHFKSKLS